MAKDKLGPSLEELLTFLNWVEHRDQGNAAKRMGMSASVVSRRLDMLRESYGLLANRGASEPLSEKGKRAIPTIRRLLRDYEHLVAWLKEKEAEPNILTVAVGNWGASHDLPPLVAKFKASHPDWKVHVKVCRGRERVLGVVEGFYDLALVSHDNAQILTLAGSVPVTTMPHKSEPLVLAYAPSHPRAEQLSKSQSVPVGELADQELIGLDERSGIRRQIEAALRQRRQVPPRFNTLAGGWHAALAYARLGLGIAIVPHGVAAADARGLQIRTLSPEIVIRESWLFRADDGREELRSLIDGPESQPRTTS